VLQEIRNHVGEELARKGAAPLFLDYMQILESNGLQG